MGVREDPLDEARQLIEERRYNEAIDVISQVMKEQPRKFDDAEKLMGEIRTFRAEYNRVYSQLIEVLNIQEGEELNEEEAYTIIQRLEELDADPNQASVAAFAEARKSIVFTVNNQRFRGIMSEGDRLLEQLRYYDAIENYLSGFDLHRRQFEDEGYGRSVITQIEALKSEIRSLSGEFDQANIALENRMEDIVVEGPETDPGWADLQADYSSLLELWSNITAAARNIEQVRDSIIETGETDIPYLSTLGILTKGRDESEGPNGIAGAVERPLVASLEEVAGEMLAETEILFVNAKEQYDQQDEEAIVISFTGVIEFILEVRPLLSFWTELHNRRIEMEMSHKIGPSQEESQSDLYYIDAMETASRIYMDTVRIATELDTAGDAEGSPEEIAARRQELLGVLSRIDSAATQAEVFIDEAQEYESRGVATDRALAVMDLLASSINFQRDRARLIEGSYVVALAGRRFDENGELITQGENNVKTSERYVEGFEEVLPDSETAVTVKYPQRSVQILRPVLETIQSARDEINGILSSIDEEKDYIREQEQLRLTRARGEELLGRIQTLLENIQSILNTADSLNRNADIAFSEGEIRLQQAQDQLNNARFEVARERLEQAGNSFSESLTFREDPEVRRLIDERIPGIAEQIIFRQNQIVVTEVRQLIDEGRNFFFTEQFIQAEQVLKSAQSKWRLTHTEDDPEIDLWLNRVERALEATSGVVIKEDDPLFADMMQVLNLALEDYDRGEGLFEEGNREQALESFRQAERKIEYIKEPFPNNQAASVLYLRILQFTEPEDFETIFRDKFRDARVLLESSPEEAYRELQVLREISREYPGLDEAIYDAEIATGIRQPPPDPQKLARARDLYGQAERIVEQDIRAQFPIALTYLNEAINLDPDYRDAIVLKDRIQTGQGGQISVVLSSVDQQRLRQAENLFIDGRYFEASALVEQLWQNPENRSNPKLVDLRRRIESQL